jgi:Uma2 family endonuclease
VKTEQVTAIPVHNGELFPLSVEAYHVLGEAGLLPKNTELLYGLVYKKMPKSPIHAVIIDRLMEAVAGLPRPLFWARSEQPITCGDSEPEPDVSVVVGHRDDYLRAHPRTAEFVAEVCVTSYEYDRSKLQAYAVAGVKECWLALQPEQVVEVYRNPVNGVFLEKQIVGPGGQLTCRSLAGVSVDLGQLFRE